ncbi:DUF6915 family protein [Actinomadura yumaensis]|uniref:DUF6915 family protein n=1 Tax=Actinomadura yumaensis TaxID=111807 RepID=UPI0036090834
MNSWRHAHSSAHKWGGTPEDYIEIHEFIDSSKKIIGDVRHRSLYHHTEGVWLCQRIFGRVLTIPKTGGGHKQVPVREVAERHIIEDLGWLPSPPTTSTACPSSRGCPARKPAPSPCPSSTSPEPLSDHQR